MFSRKVRMILEFLMTRFAAITLLSLATLASAQTAATPVSPSAASAGRTPIAKPVNNDQTASVSQLMAKNGGSLFRATLQAEAQPNQATLRDVSFFSVPEPEPRVLRRHDLVTVIVREESAFKSAGSTDVKKNASLEAKIDEFISLDLENISIKGGAQGVNPPKVKMSGARDFKGEGSVDRTDSMTARIAAEVVDVKPNGTLVLQGSKRIKTDDEEQQFIITGICRVADVSADNSVLSTNLYDLSLEKKHKGAVRDATRRGWFTKLLDVLNPF